MHFIVLQSETDTFLAECKLEFYFIGAIILSTKPAASVCPRNKFDRIRRFLWTLVNKLRLRVVRKLLVARFGKGKEKVIAHCSGASNNM